MAKSNYSTFHQWQLQRQLGTGGFGEVLLWKNHSTRQYIATKHIRGGSPLSADQQIKLDERWRKEFHWTREFKNVDCIVVGIKLEEHDPKFVQYLNENHACKLPVIILEYCDGGDVRKRLQLAENANGLRELEVRNILESMRKALHFLHSECNVCHRDLKPDNIVIQRNANGKKIYKLTDFGLARQSPDKTILQSVVGTRHYFAPEVIATGKYNKSVDYWSLGIIAYELTTGTLPFIPHQTPKNILENLLLKKPEHIAITEHVFKRKFQFQTKLPLEHNLTQCWAKQLEQWIPLALELDYHKRGELVAATDEVQAGLPVVFKVLEDLVKLKVLTIFAVSCYKRLAYTILPNMTMMDLSHSIELDTGIPKNSILFILPTGHPHKKLTLNTRPTDLYVEEWLDTSEGVKHSPVMLYVFNATIKEQFQAAPPRIPDLILTNLNSNLKTDQAWMLEHCWSLVHYVASTEQENLKLFLYGLKEYAIFLEDEYVQYGERVAILNEEKLKVSGAYNLLKRYLQTMGNLQNSEWLLQDKECMRIMDLAEKTKSHYESGLRNSKQLVIEAQKLNKEWIDLDLFNVTSLRKSRGGRKDVQQNFNLIYEMLSERDKFLKDPGIRNLSYSLPQLHYYFDSFATSSQGCYHSLEVCQDKLLQYQVEMLTPQVQPQALAMSDLNSFMQHLSVNVSEDSLDNPATDTLIRESLHMEQLMRQDIGTDQSEFL